MISGLHCAFNSIIRMQVHPKMNILSTFTHPHVVPTSWDFLLSLKHKLRYFLWKLRAVLLLH